MQSKKNKIIVVVTFITILLTIGFILATKLDKDKPVRIKGYKTDFNPNMIDSIEKEYQKK